MVCSKSIQLLLRSFLFSSNDLIRSRVLCILVAVYLYRVYIIKAINNKHTFTFSLFCMISHNFHCPLATSSVRLFSSCTLGL